MKFLPKRTSYSVLLVLMLAGILVALAILQYRWIGRISEAENEHMHSSLRTSMDQFRRQFHNDLQALGALARPSNSTIARRDWNSYAENCSALFRNSGSHMVRNVYLWIREDSGTSQLLKLNMISRSFEEISWPSNLESIHTQYAQLFSSSYRPGASFRPFVWTMFYRIPMMVQPLFSLPPLPESPRPNFQLSGYVMIELNSETIYKEVFPELTQRIFKRPEGYIYQIAVVESGKTESLLYRSDPGLTIESFANHDARIPLLERRRERFDFSPPRPDSEPQQSGNLMPQPFGDNDRQPGIVERPQPSGSGNQPRPMIPSRALSDIPVGPRFMSMIQYENDGSGWELIAKHHKGSLDAAVAQARLRNLAISFGSLLLLAVSMALIIVSARRAQRLARLQLDFVAGVSHELRTPLAVICSAGDNLAEGVLETSHRSAKEYGKLILNEGRKLSGMVEQILQYTATQRRTHSLNLRNTNLNEIVEAALEQMHPALVSAGFVVEKKLDSGLPAVRVDAAAITRCFHNLIQNAIKYSRESRWIGIRTAIAPGKRNPEVRLIVEDKGMGIDGEDLLHIFEPFYRGRAAAAEQIHGSGLGLFLARETIISMQGKISVKSVPGKGSAFTVRLPAAPLSEDNSN
jgi:two-component system, OmpR family, sensor histidine kinase SenX3